VALGISHPCTTLDRWQVLALVDDTGRVVEAVTTCF
jgi:D-serine dehydratase